MKGFFDRMAARARGDEPRVVLRARSRFEPRGGGILARWTPDPVASAEPRPTPSGPVAPMSATGPSPEPPAVATRPSRASAPDGRPSAGPPTADEVAETGRAAATGAAAVPAAVWSPVAYPRETARHRAKGLAGHPPVAPAVPDGSTGRGRLEGPAAEPPAATPEPANSVAGLLVPAEMPPPEHGRIPEADDALPTAFELLRDHVVPVLAASGVIPPHERADVRTPDAPGTARPPAPGRATVTAGRTRIADQSDRPGGYPGHREVHVHIDRVEVVRRAPDPAPPRSVTPRVDLDTYLERRRELR